MSLAGDLERGRLHHKERRLEATLRALRERQGDGRPPPGLGHAIADFQRERKQVRARLATLDRKAGSPASQVSGPGRLLTH